MEKTIAPAGRLKLKVIGIANGDERVDAVRAGGAVHVIDRAVEDVREAVHEYTGGGVAAVFDPIGASSCENSMQLPREAA